MNTQYVCYPLIYASSKVLTPMVRGESQYFMTCTGNCTVTIAKGVKGDIVTLFLTSDATPREITFGNYFTSTGTLILVASQESVIQFYYDGSTWKETWRINGNYKGILPLSVQGDIIYSSSTNTWSVLAKDASATRYLSNTGSSNNPAWSQVNLSNGVTGAFTNTGLTVLDTRADHTLTLKPNENLTGN